MITNLIHNMLPTYLSDEQMKKLPTKRLLAYYKKYRSKRSYGVCGCCGEILDQDDVAVNEQFNAYLDRIKSELDTRENVE